MQNYQFLSDIENKLDSEAKEFEPYKKSELLLSRFFYDKIKQCLLNLNIEDIKKTLLINAQQYMLDNNKLENGILENHSNNNTYSKNDMYNNSNLQSEKKDALGKTSTNSKEQNNYTEGNMEQGGAINLPTGKKSNEHLQNEPSRNGKETNTNTNKDTKNPYLFNPIDEKTFQAVPALTRRRAKLEDVNRVYKTLYEMAIKEGYCKPIEKSELQQMNLQVFGQTGEAKLATLRYLKIIEILNKTGSVRLLHCAGIKKKKKRRGNFK